MGAASGRGVSARVSRSPWGGGDREQGQGWGAPGLGFCLPLQRAQAAHSAQGVNPPVWTEEEPHSPDTCFQGRVSVGVTFVAPVPKAGGCWVSLSPSGSVTVSLAPPEVCVIRCPPHPHP